MYVCSTAGLCIKILNIWYFFIADVSITERLALMERQLEDIQLAKLRD